MEYKPASPKYNIKMRFVGLDDYETGKQAL
jgi:hypothetical protein